MPTQKLALYLAHSRRPDSIKMIEPDGPGWISQPVAFRGKDFALSGGNWTILCFSLTTFKISRPWLLFLVTNKPAENTVLFSAEACFCVSSNPAIFISPKLFHLRLSGAPRLFHSSKRPCAFSPERLGSLLIGRFYVWCVVRDKHLLFFFCCCSWNYLGQLNCLLLCKGSCLSALFPFPLPPLHRSLQ